jgi:putative flippase GtrA
MNKEVTNYLLFGILTTLVNILSFMFLDKYMDLDYKISTTIAWLASVIFAYVTNKIYVFNNKEHSVKGVMKELFSFAFFRVLSYLIDIGFIILFVEVFRLDSLVAKIITNVMVVIFNYFASKFIIFRKKTSNGV